MNHTDKQALVNRANIRRGAISDEKGPEYAGSGSAYTADETDVLQNFKLMGERFDMSALLVAGIYGMKHADAIVTTLRELAQAHTYIERMDIVMRGEGLVSRLDDLRNYCTDPGSRVLTRSLEWKPAGDLEIGEELWAFDEFPSAPGRNNSRRWVRAAVSAVEESKRPCVRVHLSNDDSHIVTTDHPLLCRRYIGYPVVWKRAEELLPGWEVPFYFTPWSRESCWDAGWLAGLFDGEGSFSNKGNALCVSQKPGRTFDEIVSKVRRLGFEYSIRPNANGVSVMHVLGPMSEKLRLLGTIGAKRLIDKFDASGTVEAAVLQKSSVASVIGIELIGIRDITALKTTSGTFFSEGMGAHNCDLIECLLQDAGTHPEYNCWPVWTVAPDVEAPDYSETEGGLAGFAGTYIPKRSEGYISDEDLEHKNVDGGW